MYSKQNTVALASWGKPWPRCFSTVQFFIVYSKQKQKRNDLGDFFHVNNANAYIGRTHRELGKMPIICAIEKLLL